MQLICKMATLILAMFLANLSFCQIGNSILFLERIYFGTDVFMPGHYKKNDIKLSFSSQSFTTHNAHDNFKFAYSFNDKYFTKINYKRNNNFGSNNSSVAIFGINEFDFSLGYHKYLKLKNYNEKKESKRALKLDWRNEKRKLRGEDPIPFRPNPKQAAFLLESALCYGFANLNGTDTYRISGSSINFRENTLDLKVERLNLDLCVYYITRSIFEFSYNLRSSMVNFKNITLKNIDPIDAPNAFDNYFIVTDFIKSKDPFFVFESNFKIALNFKTVDLYIKINDVFGKQIIRYNNIDGLPLKYANVVYNNSGVLGFSFDIDALSALMKS